MRSNLYLILLEKKNWDTQINGNKFKLDKKTIWMTYINTEVIQHTCLPRPNSGIKMNEERFNIFNSSFFYEFYSF